MDPTDPTGNSEFWKQFAGSGSANLLTILAVGLLWGLKKVCSRRTKCKSHLHTCCLDVEVRDDGVYVALDTPLDGALSHVRTATDVMAETMVAWGVRWVSVTKSPRR